MKLPLPRTTMRADVRGMSAHVGGHVENQYIQIGIDHVKVFYTHIGIDRKPVRVH